jgi:hydroxyethylthiazole kinase-like uncharacterized protein yjeF
MKVVTARQMQAIDRAAIEEMGLPGSVLMGMAGKAVADYITGIFPRIKNAAVFSGTGNNGGDGFVAAYFLANRRIDIGLFLVGDPDKISDTSRIYYNLCVNSGIQITPIRATEDTTGINFDGYDLIIDAMMGTGVAGKVRGIVSDVIRLINDADIPVLSIDIPSGLEADGSAPEGEAVIADYTVTIGLPKISLVTYPGMSYSGILHVADIGFPKTHTESEDLKIELADPVFFEKNSIPELESAYCSVQDTHKGERGHLLLVGGFEGMEGAIMMTALAALENGVGLASLVTTPASRAVIAGKIPELITKALPEISLSRQERVSTETLSDLFEGRTYNVLVIGPGMGRTPFAKAIFEAIIENIFHFGVKRVLVDGDGLFHLAEYLENHMLDGRLEFIITPHFMEAHRLSGIPVETISSNRLNAAGILSRKLSCITLLKGPATIISDGDRYIINTTGSPALATAGSGDVLSGIIGSFLLRKFGSLHAAAFGAYIHGRAADSYCSENQTGILKATDLIRHIRIAKRFSAAGEYPETLLRGHFIE